MRLTDSQIHQLEQLGWGFYPLGPEEWGWLKTDKSSNCGDPFCCVIAHQGDETWINDISSLNTEK